jgi:hypothetical protein
MGLDFSIALENPVDRQHVVLLYEEDALHSAVARFINECLKKEQLCVYSSVSSDRNQIETISSLIANSKENRIVETLSLLTWHRYM